MKALATIDPEINLLIEKESQRLEAEINLIASENYADPSVLQAAGSILTNKYAEGYPGKRYYGGCEYVDMVENLAIERCKKLFESEYINVQPHAGSQANMAAYFAILKPGDTIMGMSLAEGGHLTHGHGVNFSGQFYKSVQYKVNQETEMLDYQEIAHLAEKHKPKLIVTGASAYSRTIDFNKLSSIAKEHGALLMADIAHIAGLVAAGLHPTPVGSADIITSTTHKTLRGPRGGLIMCDNAYAQNVDKAIMPGTQGGPFMHIIAAKAVAFELALQPEFKIYQQQVLKNAHIMAQGLQELGYRIVTGGTDNHLFIVDLRSKGLNGKIAEDALSKVGIVISRSCVPFDTQKPWITSGIRIGSPAITTRGMKENQAQIIVELIDQTLLHRDNDSALARIKDTVQKLCKQFPIYT